MQGGTIAVQGLDELRRELKKLDLTDDLKQANYDAAELVVRSAQSRASSKLERKAARSLKPSRAAAKAVVTGGGAKAPFFGGAEFGAQQNRKRTSPSGRTFLGHNQFQPWRGSGSTAGYFLYPAIRAETARIVEIYGDAIDRITKPAFPD